MDISIIEKKLKQEGEIVTKRIEKWAKEIPNKTFFFYGEEKRSISFKEFNQLTNSIAHKLQSMGIRKGDRVSVFLKNPLATTLSMFSIWKIGALYCPINPSYMEGLLSYQINDTKPQLLIAEKDLISFINGIKNDIDSVPVVIFAPKKNEHDYNPQTAGIKLDKKFQEIPFDSFMDGETSDIDIILKYNDIANIIYTSGTTGPAKGVIQSHRYVYQYQMWWRTLTHQEDVIYNDLPMYHIAGAFQNVVRAAWVGCTTAVWDKFSPTDFWNRISISGSTSVILLDVMIPWLLNPEETPDDRKNTINKAYMQPMPLDHYKIASRFGFDFVVVGFGQSEAGCGLCGLIEELDEGEGTPLDLYKGYSHDEMRTLAEAFGSPAVSGKKEFKKGYMGVPPFFMEAAILNEDDEECPPGTVGQICFRAKLPHTIFNEYFGKPEVTVKATKNHWFHSGDVGLISEEGFFYFVDRMSGRIRRRGENISSSQLEEIFNGHPCINCSAAFPIPAQGGMEDEIVVYIVPQPGQTIEEQDIRRYIEGKMPKYMYPQYIRIVNDLPRTPTTKIEKYKLREDILRELGRL